MSRTRTYGTRGNPSPPHLPRRAINVTSNHVRPPPLPSHACLHSHGLRRSHWHQFLWKTTLANSEGTIHGLEFFQLRQAQEKEAIECVEHIWRCLWDLSVPSNDSLFALLQEVMSAFDVHQVRLAEQRECSANPEGVARVGWLIATPLEASDLAMDTPQFQVPEFLGRKRIQSVHEHEGRHRREGRSTMRLLIGYERNATLESEALTNELYGLVLVDTAPIAEHGGNGAGAVQVTHIALRAVQSRREAAVLSLEGRDCLDDVSSVHARKVISQREQDGQGRVGHGNVP
mmetsp:Transcript_29497/g.86005  ORF Transcript_29497/g.86005 Transcript_29497/m.86005 type:complete len:288 (-) Transcript_29497:433-1296(-)